MSTWSDKFIEFFIRNYDDIKELDKLSEYAKGRLPGILDSAMKDCIYELQGETIGVGSEENAVWWFYKDEYREEEDQGEWFCYESSWGMLFKDTDSSDVASFYLYVSTGSLKTKAQKKKYIDDLISRLEKESGVLRRNGIKFEKVEDYGADVPVLVCAIQREEIMATIVDRTKLRDTMQQAVSNFTETIRSILKPMPARPVTYD